MQQLLKNGIRHLKHRFARGALILIYHRISDSQVDPWSLSVSPAHFAEHLAVLRRSFCPTSLQDLERSIDGHSALTNKSIVITFDDGYADNLYAALPLLERFDIPATIFITTGAIGSQHDFWWDELAGLILAKHPLPDRLDLTIDQHDYSWQPDDALQGNNASSPNGIWRAGQPPQSKRQALYLELWQLINRLPNERQKEVMSTLRAWAGIPSYAPMHRIMDQDELVRLAQAKQIQVGGHTVNHVPLAGLSRDLQWNEIRNSKLQLENILNQPVRSFSYPFGKKNDFTVETISLVQEAGFSLACCNESGVVGSRTDPFQLPRIHIHDCGGDEFEARLLTKFHARS